MRNFSIDHFPHPGGEFKIKSVLIMDGPFMSIDPIGEKNIFIIGDVINTVHETYIGKLPKFNPKFLPLLDKGIIKNPILTNKELFLKSAANFFPDISSYYINPRVIIFSIIICRICFFIKQRY